MSIYIKNLIKSKLERERNHHQEANRTDMKS